MPQTVNGCLYPTNAEFTQLQKDLMPRFEQGRLAFDILPFKNSDYAQIIINRPDIFRGMQQFRGLGKPTQQGGKHNPYGKNCVIQPGYWGEHRCIDEEFMTQAAQPGTCASVIDLTEEIARNTQLLMERRYNRVEFNIWQALIFGTYKALNNQGQTVFEQYFNIQQITTGIPWSDAENSRPLNDFRCIQLQGRGTSADFGNCAKAYMNRVTANCLFKNSNPNDIGNQFAQNGCCGALMGPDYVNQQLMSQGLPNIAIYDEGWVDDSENFHPYIPDGYVLFVGCRPGNEPIGHYYLTRNMVDCNVSSGFWMKMHDNCNYAVPREIAVYDGHNGGVGISYPRAIAVLNTQCVNDC